LAITRFVFASFWHIFFCMSSSTAVRFFFPIIILLLLLVNACATVQKRPVPSSPKEDEAHVQRPAPSPEREDERERIVEYAKSLLGRKELESVGKWFRSDCSGYVVGVYRSLGYRLTIESHPDDPSVAQSLFWTLQMRNLLYRNRRPKKADLVFFRGTTDRRRYRISHVGLVAGVEGDETVLILHYSSGGVQELRMNLRKPDAHKNRIGLVINDFLRKGLGDRLSGQLFYSYGDILQQVKQ